MRTDMKQLKAKTMRKIYTVWFMRRVLPLLCAEFFVLTGIIVGVQSYISFAQIFENAAFRITTHSIGNFGNFWLDALIHTELSVLFLMTGALIIGALAARDSWKVGRRMAGNFLRTPRVI